MISNSLSPNTSKMVILIFRKDCLITPKGVLVESQSDGIIDIADIENTIPYTIDDIISNN